MALKPRIHLNPLGSGMDLLQVALIGPNGNHGILVDDQHFRARYATSLPALRQCPGQGTPNSRLVFENNQY
jgi:hypothetical protein